MDATGGGRDVSSRRAPEIVNLVDDEDNVDANASVWPGFTDLDEMDLWKGIVLSMGKGDFPNERMRAKLEPSYEVCKKYKQKEQGNESILEGTPNKNSESKPFVVLSDTATEEDETASEEDEPVAPQKVTITTASQNAGGLAGLNRVQMEKERLERAKRRGIESTTTEPAGKRMKTENVNKQGSAISKGLLVRDSNQATSNSTATHSNSSLQFPNGVIKWTYVVGYPKESHHITIEEVLQKNTLKAAVLSGFQVKPFHSSTYLD